jgi:hypothetical protein
MDDDPSWHHDGECGRVVSYWQAQAKWGQPSPTLRTPNARPSKLAGPRAKRRKVRRWASAATGSWCAHWPGTELRRRITATLAGRGRDSGRRPVLPPCRVRSFVRSLERQAAGPVLANPEASCIAPDRGAILGWRSTEDRPGFKSRTWHARRTKPNCQ